MSDPIITLKDATNAGFCVDAVRPFMQKRGLWQQFSRHGLPLSEMRKLDGAEAYVDDIVAQKGLTDGE